METPLTNNIGSSKPFPDLTVYEANGGYQAVRDTIGKRSSAEVLEIVRDSNLRGRGGAGVSTGMKWGFVPMDDATPGHKYLVANADEMEPGTFKDRVLMEFDPHQLIEGMILAAYAIQADIGYIFIRSDYYLATARLKAAIAESRDKGYLGKRILGTDYGFELHVHVSAGRYICGEETALLNSLEGKRANPRTKPPFPPVSGLWGRPTIVNNVETLCCVTHIVNKGADWFKSLGVGADAGTKLFGASGKVKNPGCWELPMGTPIREILEGSAGGMQDGYSLKGFLPGGGSTGFLTPEHLDLAMDYDVIMGVKSRLGTGTMIILDDKTCPIGMVENLVNFFARESCGFCTPCRDGLPWIEEILHKLEAGEGEPDDLNILDQQARFIDWWGSDSASNGNTHCPLAPGAIEPLETARKYFADDFTRHIRDRKCSYR